MYSTRKKGVSPLSARSATKRERGACPRKGRQPRRSGCAVRPRRTTEHGAGVLAVRRAGRREADKGLAGRSLPAGGGARNREGFRETVPPRPRPPPPLFPPPAVPVSFVPGLRVEGDPAGGSVY